MTRVVIAGGSGLIGRALAGSLLRDGIAVDVLTRSPRRAAGRLPAGARTVPWDTVDPDGGTSVAATLRGAEAVVNLCGVPVGPWPWTSGRRRRIVESRVGSTARLVDAMALLEPADRPAAFVCAAGTDAYTGLDRAPATEATGTTEAHGYLSELGRAWEEAAERATGLGVRVVTIRTALVLARGSTLLSILTLPVRLGVGGRYGDGSQWFSWIHIDDLVAAYRLAIVDGGLAGPTIAASPEPCPQRDVAAAMARTLHRPNWTRVPAWLLRVVLREQATLLLGSVRLRPARLLEAGLTFTYSDLDSALRDVLGRGDRGDTGGRR